MTRIAFLLVAFLGLAVEAQTQEQKEKPAFKLSAEEQQIVDRTNAERKKANLPELKVSPLLTAAARSHAENMAKQGKSEHVLDGKDAAARVKDTGYKGGYVGENIAWNQKDAEQVLGDWMNSQGHKDNILRKEYTEIGVAVARTKSGEPHWVQVFGRPR